MWSRHTRHSATRLRRECGKQEETKQSHNSDEKSDDDVRKKKNPHTYKGMVKDSRRPKSKHLLSYLLSTLSENETEKKKTRATKKEKKTLQKLRGVLRLRFSHGPPLLPPYVT